jgi:hypothetical protein
MKHVFKGLVVVVAIALLAPAVRAEDVPNINKRGDDEEEFVKKVGFAVVNAARPSVKRLTLQEYKFKEPKEGRKNLHISVGYRGGITSTKYSADVIVKLDTSEKGRWEVLSIEYEDNNKNVVGWNRKNVETLVKDINKASR